MKTPDHPETEKMNGDLAQHRSSADHALPSLSVEERLQQEYLMVPTERYNGLIAQRDELARELVSLAKFAEEHIGPNIRGNHRALAAGQCEELADRARAALARSAKP